MPVDIFDKLPLFADLTPAQRAVLHPIFVPCDCYGDDQLFAQGDAAEYLYLVVSGEVIITYHPEDGTEILVTHIREGGVVGWSAALGNHSYTSSAACTCYTQMLRVRGADLRLLCQEYPDTGILILDRLAAVIAKRLRNTHEQVISLLKQGLLNET